MSLGIVSYEQQRLRRRLGAAVPVHASRRSGFGLGIPYPFSSPSVVAAATDPFWADVVLLAMNESGPDGGTTFDDASNSNHTITAVGNAQWDTDWAPAGLSSSGLIDGNGDYWSIANSTALDQTGDFTHEAVVKFDGDGLGTVDILFNKNVNSYLYLARNKPNGKFQVSEHNIAADRILGTTTVVIGTQYHVAVCRSGSTVRLFVNGTQEGSNYTNSASISGTATSYIGWFTTHFPQAHYAAVRITNAARYTANFTPPTLPLPTS